MTFPELLAVTTSETLHVMPDPELAGRHPCHDSRFLTTFTEWDDDVFFTGRIIASMRDVLKQREEALRLVHSRNTLPRLYEAAREVIRCWEKGELTEAVRALDAACEAVHDVE